MVINHFMPISLKLLIYYLKYVDLRDCTVRTVHLFIEGFIEFIVSPTFLVLSDMVEHIASAQQLVTPSTTPNNCTNTSTVLCKLIERTRKHSAINTLLYIKLRTHDVQTSR